MALGRAFSVAVLGLDGQIVEIEADITPGPRRDHQLQQQVADVAPHAGAVTGDAAENGVGL
jgi:hypothetical protein